MNKKFVFAILLVLNLSFAFIYAFTQPAAAAAAVISNVTININAHLGTTVANDVLESGTWVCFYDASEFSQAAFLGLISEALPVVASGNASGEYRVNITFVGANAYLAFSKGSCTNLKKYVTAIRDKTFLQGMAAFAYPYNKFLQLVLKYTGIDLLSELQFTKGNYLIVIKNEGYNQTAGKEMLSMRIVK